MFMLCSQGRGERDPFSTLEVASAQPFKETALPKVDWRLARRESRGRNGIKAKVLRSIFSGQRPGVSGGRSIRAKARSKSPAHHSAPSRTPRRPASQCLGIGAVQTKAPAAALVLPFRNHIHRL